MKHKINPLRHHIQFYTKDNLHIQIKTERLVIRSTMQEDEENFAAMTADPIVMEKFGTGVSWEEKNVKDRMSIWLKRWKDHDPYSAYSILDKKSGEFIGIITIGHSSPGESEPSYIINRRFWGKGFGSEAADAVFQSLIPRLMMRNYDLENKPLKKLVATARLDNPASQQMLKGVGFKEEDKIRKFGNWRFLFGMFAKQLRNEHQNFFIKRDQKLNQQEQARLRNTGVGVTLEDMAASDFGQQSHTAKKLCRK
jgi:ribosomal-protein-alanine N-acetyltransferase